MSYFFNWFRRSRKASITTGIVERSDPSKNDAIDRLSPLTNNGMPFLTTHNPCDLSTDFEKFIDTDFETNIPASPAQVKTLFMTYGITSNSGK